MLEWPVATVTTRLPDVVSGLVFRETYASGDVARSEDYAVADFAAVVPLRG